MPSPLDTSDLALALSVITEAASCIAEARYAEVERIAHEVAHGPRENAEFILNAAFTTIAAFASKEGKVRDVMDRHSRSALAQTQFMADVMDGIDMLPGDDLKDPFTDPLVGDELKGPGDAG